MFELAPAVGMSGNYQIKKSLRFNSADSAYLARTPSVSGNQQTFTFSCWIKLSAPGALQRLFGAGYYATTWYFSYINVTGDQLQYEDYVNNAAVAVKTTTQVFRDPSAHYHIVVVRDSTNATAGDRIRIYVNGVRVTSFSASTDPAQNAAGYISSTYGHRLGVLPDNSQPSSFYLSEVNFIDGQTLTPSSFGKTDSVTGQWIPKKYTGTYGTNGFYLPFNDGTSTTTLGYDRSGNSNNWTLTNFSVAAGVNNDWLDDSPTNNYCTLNPLDVVHTIATISDGALKHIGAAGNRWSRASVAQSTGKWYVEYTLLDATPTSGAALQLSASVSQDLVNWNLYSGAVSVNGSVAITIAGATTNDVIAVAFDVDARTAALYKNGTLLYTATGISSSAPNFVPQIFTGAVQNIAANFGQRPFAYTPPTGFESLCTKNLPTPTIKKSSKYFDVKTYVGNGSTNSITGLNFQPDFVWGKARSFTQSNGLYDSVRGVTKALYSDLTNAEATDVNALTSFNADGFSMGSSGSLNQNAASYVAWNWKESPTSGFDIVTYIGDGTSNRAVPHSLGVTPKLYITKGRGVADNWPVRHTLVDGSLDYLYLNLTNANANAAESAPTSTSFYVANGADNTNGVSYIAYCFAEVPGFSKMGKYTGNGLADGPFVYCGFKPRFILIKRTDGVTNWEVFDTARDSYNVSYLELYPNSSSAENASTADEIDVVSNGFKLRSTNAIHNASNGTYIFMAFAEAPFKYSTAR